MTIRWPGIGGRTALKTRNFDLHVVKAFAPYVVALPLGTNDLATTSVVETCSAIVDLCLLLHESYGVKVVCVCQTLYGDNAMSFKAGFYLKAVLPPRNLGLMRISRSRSKQSKNYSLFP